MRAPSQPSYRGQPLSSWLEAFDTTPWDTNAEAFVAIRAMGTNAIPFLIDDLTVRDPRWRSNAREKLRFSKLLWIRESPAYTSRNRASKALRALGSDAAPALPLLIERIQQTGKNSAPPWLGLSAIVPKVPETIPTVIKELGAPQYRLEVSRFLVIHATNATGAVPFLLQCTKDEDWQIRRYALIGLEKLGPDASCAEAAVRDLLDDPNPGVSARATAALESIRLNGSLHGSQGAQINWSESQLGYPWSAQ